MLRASGVLAIALLVVPGAAKAGNTDDVIAGNDVALTGGAVVANVHTGGAMWFNPAGVARLDSRAVDLTGAVLSYSIANAPGSLSIESGEQSAGDYSAAATSEAISRSYVRRAPEHRVLHRVVREHLQTFLWEIERHDEQRGAPGVREA